MSVLIEKLLEEGIITKEQLKDAKAKQKCEKKPLHDILIDMGVIDEKDLIKVASKVFNMPLFDFDLEKNAIDENVTKLVSYEKVKHYGIFPIRQDGGKLLVAMSDPNDIIAIDDLRVITNMEIQPLLAKKSQIDEYAEKYYHSDDNLYNRLKNIHEESEVKVEEVMQSENSIVNIEMLKGDTAPVVKLLNFILSDAVKARASDIHIEPQKDTVAIRYRVDGAISDITTISRTLLASLVARIKIVSDLDIAETRTPQDGRTSISIGDRIVDMRISTIPTVHGEKAEMRILDPKEAKTELSQIGFEKAELEKFKEALGSTQGMVLVTGPTGSGKTSTLYAALNFVKGTNKNIVTIEDPVEYVVDGINQIQVNPVKDVSFAMGLRSILRQDPDVILIGEIRDKETAEISLRASLTGHMVLSTLHTNSSVATIARLFDIGLEPYMISSALIMVIAQRLVRRICPNCKKEYTPEDLLIEKFKTYIDKFNITKFYKGEGCYKCGFIGYTGRVAIFEILKITEAIKAFINDKVPEDMIFHEAKKEGLHSLAESGIQKVAAGITSLEEISRVVEVMEKDETMEHSQTVGGTPRILVAEDEEDLLKVLEKHLVSAGFIVIKARDGKELVKYAIREKPDIIISDVTMPKMNGFEAVKILRARLETANIPIMMLTARDDKESEIKGIEAGADDYIPKPCDGEKLLARLKMLLRRRGWQN